MPVASSSVDQVLSWNFKMPDNVAPVIVQLPRDLQSAPGRAAVTSEPIIDCDLMSFTTSLLTSLIFAVIPSYVMVPLT